MESTARVLIVDDDRSFRHLLQEGLSGQGYELKSAGSVAECVVEIENGNTDLLLLDLNLPDGNGIEVLRSVRNADTDLPIILITGEGDSDSAILASRLGARDFLRKPIQLSKLRQTVREVLARTATATVDESTSILKPMMAPDPFIGRSGEMQAVFKSIGRVARQNVTVLIRGESGVGKELVARSLWKHSDRASQSFLAINCAALSSELLESELFGHEKGAFTGADRQHIGKFEACSRGTLFLDEVGDMPSEMQAKLLRVLQDRTFTRVGGNQVIKTNARIISATNRGLEPLIKDGAFREDLFHRLNGFTINIPALRDRGDDIELLLSYFLDRNNQRLHKTLNGIASEAVELLKQYPWPGNVRELESTLGQIMLNTHGPLIEVADLPAHMQAGGNNGADLIAKRTPIATRSDSPDGSFEAFVFGQIDDDADGIYGRVIDFAERFLLTHILSSTQGNQSAAAKRLGITRGSLRFKLRKLGLTIDNEVNVPHRPR